ncbi:ATP-binding protein [Hyphomicrobium sp.]|jgi:two-component system sensor histidine kinase RegB|uniref:ATP-binding protein n=1 Tax=Hyphomicrobium sp. TaxID=82 RepID=UPI003566BE97
MLNRGERSPGPEVDIDPALARVSRSGDSAGVKNMLLLIQLRWIAVAGQIATIVFVAAVLHVNLPLVPMASVAAGLVVLNLASLLWLRDGRDVGDAGLLIALLLDVAGLTAQLYLSGGAMNPFAFLYLLQVTLAAVLLDVRLTAAVLAATCVSFALLTQIYRPLEIPPGEVDLFRLHVVGMVICFAVDAALLFAFVTRITRNLRERDARLAALKQHAAEEDHIVRMGLLASGAAHELGTPLSSLSVILGDWRRVPVIANNAELLQEVEEMQAAVKRCKSILTGVLLSAGEARGEAPRITTVATFFDELISEWRAARTPETFDYANDFGTDLSIVSDSTLKQIIFNVLDNAYDSSPAWVGVEVARDGDMLVLRISDRGRGFAPQMLAQFGKPYQSSKGKPGGGLGLFLVVNVVRKLGGGVSAVNLPEGGASVTLKLPLSALALGTRSGSSL